MQYKRGKLKLKPAEPENKARYVIAAQDLTRATNLQPKFLFTDDHSSFRVVKDFQKCLKNT